MPEMTPIFARSGSKPDDTEVSARVLNKIQRFVCAMYRKSSPHGKVNKARHEMFSDGVAIENIPPAEGVLLKKVKRAILTCITWHHALDLCSPKLDPQNLGWKKENGKWKPHWSDLPIVVDAMKTLISCGRKKKCTGNCKCVQFVGLDCTPA